MIRKEFLETATAMSWGPGYQVDILLAFIKDNALEEAFYEFLTVLVEETLGPEVPKAPEPVSPTMLTCEQPPAKIDTPELQDLSVFFKRDLAKSALARLTPTQAVFGSDSCVQLLPEAAVLHMIRQLLVIQTPDEYMPVGGIHCGWYCQFPDGDIAAFAITAGEKRAYVDAWLIPREGAYTTIPSISLPPVYTLDEPFVFNYPDGTSKVVTFPPA